MTENPLIFIISGPAGVGKTTLCGGLMNHLAGRISPAVTTTTRSPRSGEVDGVDYYFVSTETFQRGILEEEFYEYSVVHGQNFYGLTRREILRHFLCGKDVLLNMDVQGAMKMRKLAQDADSERVAKRVVTIFLQPPSMDALKERLFGRGTDSAEEIERRLRSAVLELQSAKEYDYFLPTETADVALNAMTHIYFAEKLRNRN